MAPVTITGVDVWCHIDGRQPWADKRKCLGSTENPTGKLAVPVPEVEDT